MSRIRAISRLKALRLHVDQVPSAFCNEKNASRWTNKDIDPVRPEDRKWGVLALLAYWGSDAFGLAAMQQASAILALGVSPRDALVTVAVGFFLISIVISLNGAIGVLYHAPFPVLSRASWGFWGSYLPIISRAILGIVWFSVHTMNGAYGMNVMITAIWPSFKRLPNHIPEDQGITSGLMLSFFLYWLLQLVFLFMHPNRLRYLFIAKSIVLPITMIAMLIWAFRSTGGTGGPLIQYANETTLNGSQYSYAWLTALTTVLSSFSTLSVNMSDFSRYCHVSAKWQALYLPLLPIVFTLVSFIGLACTSAGQAKYGTYMWNPLVLMTQWESRACQFFAAAAMTLGTIGLNISANSLSAANDLSAIFPRYINIRRGQLSCAFLAWVLVPWKILASAHKFLNFIGSYAVFLGPIAAILAWDFWWLHGMKYDVVALYHPNGIYRYNKFGINWRAFVAFFVGIAPNFPGFINYIDAAVDPGVGKRPFTFAWLLGFVSTTLVYMALSWIWKPSDTFIQRAVRPDEVYVADAAEGNSQGGDDSSESSNAAVSTEKAVEKV